jgi:hypothetical protein
LYFAHRNSETATMHSESQDSLSTWSILSHVLTSPPRAEPTGPVAKSNVLSPLSSSSSSSESSSSFSSSSSSSSSNDFYVDIDDDDADDEMSFSETTPPAINSRIARLIQSNETLRYRNYALHWENNQRRRNDEILTILNFFLCGVCFTLIVFLGWAVFVLRA